MAAPLTIAERQVGSCSVLQLSGKLVAEDTRVCADAVDELIDRGAVDLVINLSGVSTLDSGGVGVLVSKYLRARRAGGDLKLVCLSGHACRVLAVAGLLKIFEAFESEDAAAGSFHGVTAKST